MKTTITCIATLLLTSIAIPCFAADKIKGNGNIVTRTIPVDEFNDVCIGHNIESSSKVFGIFNREREAQPIFQYKQTTGAASLEISMDENLFENMEIDQKDGKLKIQSRNDQLRLIPTKMTVKASSTNLQKVEISGCMNFVSESRLKTEKLQISVSGVGDIQLADLEGGKVSCDVSGVGNAYLTGKADAASFNVSGVGKVFAFDCVVKELKCDVSGVGSMQVNATNSLSASTSGVGGIRYKGNATVSSSASGFGSIKRAE